MKKIILLVLLTVTALAVAHNQAYQGKAFTFHSPQQDHVIDVMLEGHSNELSVSLDNVTIGKRTNFCTPVD